MVKTHTVRPGDTLASLSKAYYGTEKGAQYIYSVNRHRVPDPNNLYIGQEIVIPHLPGNPFTC